MRKNYVFLAAIIGLFLLTVCSTQNTTNDSVKKELFGKLKTGEEVFAYTLQNKAGMQAKIINFGATLVSLTAPDKNGKYEDVTLGYDNINDYAEGTSYFGAIVGRYGNRIGKGKFTLDGKEYQLTINNGENHLHGGIKGFNKVIWNAEPETTDSTQSLKLTYLSPDGDQGYPGNLNITVVYTLHENNSLEIDYSATTDKPTILNPTHHSYFNLTGNVDNTILNHELKIDADYITPVDKGLITTGKLEKVEGTPFDFRTFHKIGERINDKDQQLEYGMGYDHNWVLNNYNGSVREVAELYEPVSGRLMQVFTDQPGLQFYSGNFLDGTIKGKGGKMYKHRTGLCLETQHYPDSPNKPDFPSARLNPGDTYKQTTIYHFTTK